IEADLFFEIFGGARVVCGITERADPHPFAVTARGTTEHGDLPVRSCQFQDERARFLGAASHHINRSAADFRAPHQSPDVNPGLEACAHAAPLKRPSVSRKFSGAAPVSLTAACGSVTRTMVPWPCSD